MPEPTPNNPPHFASLDADLTPLVVRVPKHLWAAAGSRLVGQSLVDVEVAGQRLVDAADTVGIDFGLCWGILESNPALSPAMSPKVRQACLAVLGNGRTAMLFTSEPPRGGDPGGASQGFAERVACLKVTCQELARGFRDRAHLAQALPEPSEAWAIAALQAAGLTRITTLLYLKRLDTARVSQLLQSTLVLAPAHVWPPGMAVRRADEYGSSLDNCLMRALEGSYESTLDCPELCGLRTTGDVLASHKAAGDFDPSLWWVLERDGQPEGCCLMTPSKQQRTLELVYLGLSPRARGMGLGARLLGLGMAHAQAHHRRWPVLCAVDQRNAPARALYERFGFEETSRREAMVMGLQAAHA